MDGFHNDAEGDVYFRDSLQFELKSEYPIEPGKEKTVYTQEFYLFIPKTLEINENTYFKNDFYLDQTNYIRYRTPIFTFEELLDKNNPRSPLTHLFHLVKQDSLDTYHVIDELKLLANIVRSTLREKINEYINQLPEIPEASLLNLMHFISLIQKDLAHLFQKLPASRVKYDYNYVTEFISRTAEYYLMDYQYELSQRKIQNPLENAIKNFVKTEMRYRAKPLQKNGNESYEESALYREGHLNEYILEALLLNYERISLVDKYSPWVATLSAGVAMFVYLMFLFFRGGNLFVSSFTFVMFGVVIYIIKDRIKEYIKSAYFKNVVKWIPDYSTKVYTTDKSHLIGKQDETVFFLNEDNIPQKIRVIRNEEFHSELLNLKRFESVLYYKKIFTLFPEKTKFIARRHEITSFFRLNIHQFLEKASDSFEVYPVFDVKTDSIEKRLLPKVYHLNLILKNTLERGKNINVEYQKIRIVINKQGIKRIEQIGRG